MKEAAVGRRLVAKLRTAGAWVYKVHGSGWTSAGVPDYVVIWGGQTVWVEVKAPGGRLAKTQEATHREMRGRGAIILTGSDADTLFLEIEKNARSAPPSATGRHPRRTE